jgi:phage tail-like protein
VRWTFAVRRVSELLGGDAVAAQDVLGDGERTLTLLLLPGERREAYLGFDVLLDGQTQPGDFLFEVVATDPEAEDDADFTVGALTLYHPEPMLLDYLPGIYREARCPCDEPVDGFVNRAFFQRFLLGFEDILAPLQTRLDQMDRSFGSRTAAPDFLPWLANWAAFVVDENWPELRRRALIREAAELYRWRGTRRGLSRYLEIYTGVRPEINDQPFAGMRLGAQTLLGRDTLLGDVPRHTFVVTLAVPDTSEINEQIVRDIIESEKPAHTGYALRIVRRAAARDEGSA